MTWSRCRRRWGANKLRDGPAAKAPQNKEALATTQEGDRVMKVATNLIVASALVLASAPAFAHGGMGGNMGGNMGSMGMSHGNNGMTVSTQTHDWRTNITKTDKTTTKTTTKTFFLKRLEIAFIRREIRRLDREIFRLVKDGRGNSQLVKVLEFQRAKLLHDHPVG
jgi:hypothetical protein